MSNKEKLIHYLNTTGKQQEESWLDLAIRFNIRPELDSDKRRKATQDIWRNCSPKSSQSTYPKNSYHQPNGTVSFKENIDKEEAEIIAYSDVEPTSPEQIEQILKLDKSKWRLSHYWVKYTGTKWTISAFIKRLEKKDNFQSNFIAFLDNYEWFQEEIDPYGVDQDLESICLLLNKQDAHLNKWDTDGDNNIQDRFHKIESKIEKVLKKAKISNNIEKIVYVIGSDQFNSEWTGMTTKGTPQLNMPDFYDSFERICRHETRILNMLVEYGQDVEVIYVSGNHDEFVGWHMVTWLQAFYRNQSNLTIDASPEYNKYLKFGNSAIMLNHGDVLKPAKLASIFPIQFKDRWSQCDHRYIFVGDKHHEMSLDLDGIKFYQLPSLSSSKSSWDKKRGYVCTKAEMKAFIVTKENGISDIYSELI